MPSNTREIKHRVKSVKNIRQITRAMQLVATSKMRRAEQKARGADAYAYGALGILNRLTNAAVEVREHRYWRETAENKTVALILITTNRGFCGGLNVALFGKTAAFAEEMQSRGLDLAVVTVGRKGRAFARRLGLRIVADFSEKSAGAAIRDIAPIAHIATSEFGEGAYGAVYVAYNQFINTLVQKPTIGKILPMSAELFREITETNDRAREALFRKDTFGGKNSPPDSAEKQAYLFEPDPVKVFEELVPELIRIEIYKAVLEAEASEHSARMVAMKNATDKAGDLISDLQLVYNQARQASITREIAEISGGAMATAK